MDNATIGKIAENHTGPVLYLLRLPEITIAGDDHRFLYKFGYTENLGQRLRTHLKNLGFTSIILLRSMGSLADVTSLEKQVKKLAESRDERFNLMGNTEIINSMNISDYVTLIATWSPPVTLPKKEKCFDNIKISEQSSNIVINKANCYPKLLKSTPQVRVNINKQDTLNRFLTEYLVRSPAAEAISIHSLGMRYAVWYSTMINSFVPNDIQSQLENSRIANHLERRLTGGYFLPGHRLKSCPEEALQDGEEELSDNLPTNGAGGIRKW